MKGNRAVAAAVVLPEFVFLALGAVLVWWAWRSAQLGWSDDSAARARSPS
jgi:hypothetical protein